MLYNSVLICAISKYLTSLFIHRFTKKRYGTTFMPFYYDSIFYVGGEVLQNIYTYVQPPLIVYLQLSTCGMRYFAK